jgi:hypothetical protein
MIVLVLTIHVILLMDVPPPLYPVMIKMLVLLMVVNLQPVVLIPPWIVMILMNVLLITVIPKLDVVMKFMYVNIEMPVPQ